MTSKNTDYSNDIIGEMKNINVEFVRLPYSEKDRYLTVNYDNPALNGYQVIVVKDSLPEVNPIVDEYDKSIGELGLVKERLVSIIARFPRCILSEVNTHRRFGRNSASSRARSIRVTLRDVLTDPYIPLFTENKKGMSGPFLQEDKIESATQEWLKARDNAVVSVLKLLLGGLIPDGLSNAAILEDWELWVDEYYDKVYNADEVPQVALNVHKQNANRLLEPFMWHEAIITSSEWANFLELRDEAGAQPEIIALAKLIRKALEISKPEATWVHLPFISSDKIPYITSNIDSIRDILMLSATECAQISYKDKSSASVSTATTSLGERLLKMKHLSPFEHVAFSSSINFNFQADVNLSELSGNLDSSWIQLRKVFGG